MEDSPKKRLDVMTEGLRTGAETRPLKATEQKQFDSGARRDTSINRGRYDLISNILLRRLAIHLEKGAVKYSARNWEKGIPLSRSFEALVRHAYQWQTGEVDEDHLAAVACNIMFIIHTEAMIREGKLSKGLLAELPDSYFGDEGKPQEAIDVELATLAANKPYGVKEFLTDLGSDRLSIDPPIPVSKDEKLQVNLQMHTPETERLVSEVQDMVANRIQISEATQMYDRGMTDQADLQPPQYPENQHYMAGYNQ